MNTKTSKTLILLLAALTLCLPIAAEGKERTARPRPSSAAEFDSRRIAETIYGLINRERLKKRLKPLPWDEPLYHVARDYSQEMAERGFFSHTDPDGHTFNDRYQDSGIACKVRSGNITSLGGENIAQSSLYRSSMTRGGKTTYTWYTEQEIAATVVRIWMASKGHRENILTPYFKKQGIGVFITPDKKVYVTQNFC